LLQGFVKKTFWTYMNAATIPAPASDFNALASLQNDVALADTVMPDTEFSYAEAPGLQFCEGLLKRPEPLQPSPSAGLRRTQRLISTHRKDQPMPTIHNPAGPYEGYDSPLLAAVGYHMQERYYGAEPAVAWVRTIDYLKAEFGIECSWGVFQILKRTAPFGWIRDPRRGWKLRPALPEELRAYCLAGQSDIDVCLNATDDLAQITFDAPEKLPAVPEDF
jgi:hypothetical protein